MPSCPGRDRLRDPESPDRFRLLATFIAGKVSVWDAVEAPAGKVLGEGTGLGLSQVYSFCQAIRPPHKNLSELDQGTTVKIYFPRLRANTPDEIVDVHQPVVGAEEAETILFVEDDRRSGRIWRTYCVVWTITWLPSTLRLRSIFCDRTNPSICCLLISLCLDGMAVILSNQAERFDRGFAYLFMTGYSRNAVAHQGRLDEGVDLLQKPVSQAQLAMRVRAALDRKESK